MAAPWRIAGLSRPLAQSFADCLLSLHLRRKADERAKVQSKLLDPSGPKHVLGVTGEALMRRPFESDP